MLYMLIYASTLPATGDNFLITHHRDFHWKERRKIVNLIQCSEFHYCEEFYLFKSHPENVLCIVETETNSEQQNVVRRNQERNGKKN